MADMGYDVSDYCAVDPMFGTLADFDALVAEAHRLGLKVIIDQVLSHTSDRHPWFVESRSSRDNPEGRLVCLGRPEAGRHARPTTGSRSSAGRPGNGIGARKQYYLHNFLASQPDLNFHNPEVQDALLDTVRFWLERGVDGFRLDTVNFYFHDQLADGQSAGRPSGSTVGDIPDTNPYGYQDHLYDKTPAGEPRLPERFRALLDSYGARASVGEVGDERPLAATVAAYTGRRRQAQHVLHLRPARPAVSRPRTCAKCVECLRDERQGRLGLLGLFQPRRRAPRDALGADPAQRCRTGARSSRSACCSRCAARSASIRARNWGSTEADLAFEDLRDPYGIRFWPAFKGRDGCRTPMVWEATRPRTPASRRASPGCRCHWLMRHKRSTCSRQIPARCSSTTRRYWRSASGIQPSLQNGTIDFRERQRRRAGLQVRKAGNEALLCLFNFAEGPARFVIPSEVGAVSALGFPGQEAVLSSREINLPSLGSPSSAVGSSRRPQFRGTRIAPSGLSSRRECLGSGHGRNRQSACRPRRKTAGIPRIALPRVCQAGSVVSVCSSTWTARCSTLPRRPMRSSPPEGLEADLARLSGRVGGALALVTGRSLDFIAKLSLFLT